MNIFSGFDKPHILQDVEKQTLSNLKLQRLTDDEVDVVPPELLDSDLDEDLQRQAALLRHGRHRAAEAATADHLAQDLRHQGPAVGVDLKKKEAIGHLKCHIKCC